MNRITVDVEKAELKATDKFRELSDVDLTWSLYKQMMVLLEHGLQKPKKLSQQSQIHLL